MRHPDGPRDDGDDRGTSARVTRGNARGAGRRLAESSSGRSPVDAGGAATAAAATGASDAVIANPVPTAAALILYELESTGASIRSLVEAAGFEATCETSVLALAARSEPETARFVVLGMTAVGDRDVEIVSILRRRAPDAWILVLYPAALRERAAQALALGADASLSEPYYAGELTSLARRAFARTARTQTSGPGPTAAAQPSASPASAAESRADAPPTASAEHLAAGVARTVGASLGAIERHLAGADTDGEIDVPAIRAELRGIADVAEALRRFAGHSGLDLRPTDVANVVTGVFVSRDVGAAGAEMSVRLGEAKVEVLGDAALLRAGLEAVRNRAVRVTPPEGRISVRTRNRTEGDRRMVEISVTDGGPALTADQRARLFAPFPGAPGIDDGTGLEFAGIAGIVRDHGGSVLALAAGATGTIVVIRLPALDAPTRPERAAPPARFSADS